MGRGISVRARELEDGRVVMDVENQQVARTAAFNPQTKKHEVGKKRVHPPYEVEVPANLFAAASYEAASDGLFAPGLDSTTCNTLYTSFMNWVQEVIQNPDTRSILLSGVSGITEEIQKSRRAEVMRQTAERCLADVIPVTRDSMEAQKESYRRMLELMAKTTNQEFDEAQFNNTLWPAMVERQVQDSERRIAEAASNASDSNGDDTEDDEDFQ